jgi:hypothetical protein
MMFCPVVSLVVRSWAPVILELALSISVTKPVESHVHCLGALGLNVLGDHTVCCAIVGLDGVGGCLHSISLSKSRMGITSRALM